MDVAHSARDFADEVKAHVEHRVAAMMARLEPSLATPMTPDELLDTLRQLWYAEKRACDACARWAAELPESQWELKLGLLRQAQDEGRHYVLYKKRIEELGGSVAAYDNPVWTAYWDWVEALPTVLERMAAQNFSGESAAKELLPYFAARADAKTREAIEMTIPDEEFHAALGYAALRRLADTADRQALAWAAIRGQENFTLGRALTRGGDHP